MEIDKKEEDNVELAEETLAKKDEEEKARSSLLQCAEWQFLLTQTDDVYPANLKEKTKANLLAHVEKDSMLPYYKHLCKTFGWPENGALVQKMEDQNKEELKKIEEKIEDAKKNLGDTEVREGFLARADFLARIGEKELALAAYEETKEKTAGSGGGKIDITFAMIRIALFHNDMALIKKYVETAKSLCETGGDWERRNLFKIYEAVYYLLTREIKKAAVLLMDSIATFTCYPLFSYNTFVFYTVLTSVVSVDRIVLRDKVVRAPEILSVYNEIPNVEPFLQSLYKCKYSDFFKSVAIISDQIRRDQYLAPHYNYIMREIRVVAYKQFLQSYRSVTLQSMAVAFGVSVSFLDTELSRFIANGRLNAKIDKVNGVLETNRPDAKNAQYQSVLKHGDILLNRIQKLTKIISY